MNALISFLLVVALILVGYLGGSVGPLQWVFGVIVPYLALLVFIVGFIWRVTKWAKSPVPFRIPTTCGQQKSHDWIKADSLDNPSNNLQVIGRMALEVLFFRSLFRNSTANITEDKRVVFTWSWMLWLFGLIFHYSFLVVILRHLRLFVDPVPTPILWLQNIDGFMQVGLPVLFMSSAGLLIAVTVLFVRRVVAPQIRYISLAADYFPLFLIGAIALTGIWMRHFDKVAIPPIKQLLHGLVTFSPTVPEQLGAMFFVHITLVATLVAYFPLSKLMHMGGVFMSPTRNLANNNRFVHHENPWAQELPVNFHTYEEYEDEFRQKMAAIELPLDKPLQEED